ncbi:MAG: hypothetical protein V5A34_05605 [Halapricum sp.]
MPAPYCTVTDVLRRFDPGLSVADLGSAVFGIDSAEDVRARIRAVSQDWDRDTGTALRHLRAGSPGAPRTYEYQNARRQRTRYPLRVELDHDDIVPFNAVAGDVLEIRTGRDNWDDVTDAEGDEWVLLHDSGELKVFEFLVDRIFFEAPDERYLRATYRYGALGGARGRGGETTLTSDVDATSTSLSVTNAARLPASGVMLLPNPETDSSEYVRVTDVDTDTDTLTVQRGVNGTVVAGHDEGTAVHYCPQDVRDAVAGEAAAELIRYDLSTQRQDSDDAAIPPRDKLEDWRQEYRRTKAKYSAVRRM